MTAQPQPPSGDRVQELERLLYKWLMFKAWLDALDAQTPPPTATHDSAGRLREDCPLDADGRAVTPCPQSGEDR